MIARFPETLATMQVLPVTPTDGWVGTVAISIGGALALIALVRRRRATLLSGDGVRGNAAHKMRKGE